MTIGVTGGIGSGKTVVTRVFETMGCMVYNSDDRAKEMYYKDDVKKQVTDLLGEKAYINANALNKTFISEKVFSDSKLLVKLNAIIHPAVKNDYLIFTQKHIKKNVVKESAILFETGIYRDLDSVVLIVAPLNEKISRIMKRNGISKAEVEKRMQAQWTDEQKIPMADFVIYNGKNDALIPQVLNLLKQISVKP